MNPKTDFAFKRIFGSAESSDILVSFLNAILALKSPLCIAEVTILDPYLASKIKGMKDTYLDLQAKEEQGKSYIIEMQVLNVEGFEQRILSAWWPVIGQKTGFETGPRRRRNQCENTYRSILIAFAE